MEETSNTWIVGLVRDDPKDGENTWMVIGVYDAEDRAIEVCTTDDHFVGPLVMNETNNDITELDVKCSPWPGLWFPAVGNNPWTEELIQREKKTPIAPTPEYDSEQFS